MSKIIVDTNDNRGSIIHPPQPRDDILIDDITDIYNIRVSKTFNQKRFAISKTVTFFSIIDDLKRFARIFIGFSSIEEYNRFELVITSNRLNLRGVIVVGEFIRDILSDLKRNTNYVISYKE